MLSLNQKPKSKVSWVPFYHIISLILGYIGLNYFSETFCSTFWKKSLMYAMILFQVYTTAACFIGIFLYDIYDLEDKVSCIIIFFALFNIGLKFMTLLYYSGTLRKLNDDIMTVTSRNGLEPWELELAQKYYRVTRLIFFKIIIVYSIAMFCFILMPLLSKKYYMMPVLIEYPGTNRSTHPGYEINYLLGSYCVTYGCSIEMGKIDYHRKSGCACTAAFVSIPILAVDIPAVLQASFISFQLDRSMHYCSMIGDLDSPYNTSEKQSKLLKYCIELHTSIFRFFDEVATVNTTVVALTVTTTVPLLTILMYSVMLGTISGAPVLMLSDVYHLFMYCFLGEFVSNKCEEASQAIYNSQWYQIERVDDKRMFLFFLTISQRDMRFSAGGLYDLSLETFTELMKRVYGACAFLSEVL